MKKLINDVELIVPQMLEGIVRLSTNLMLLGDENIVIRRDLDAFKAEKKVAIITGGGSGHEPAHAGYVGRGMLTAAVAGDVFASPTADAVLKAIRAVATEAGVLLVVKNYTGDRLNFGLAAETAKVEGIRVEMLIVEDDIALEVSEDNAGRRGIAGTVLVHKVVGAMAEKGESLEAVVKAARKAQAQLASIGVALEPCTVPAAGKPNFSLLENEIELGLGIHGERGVLKTSLEQAHILAGQMVDRLLSSNRLNKPSSVALLVNNLGSTPPMEQFIVARDALNYLTERGVNVERVWCGTFLTALDMSGISLSVMSLDEELLEALDAITEANSWQGCCFQPLDSNSFKIESLAQEVSQYETNKAGSQYLLKYIVAACEALIESEELLTEMDQVVGDGDIGRSLKLGSTAILNRIDELEGLSDSDRLKAMSKMIRESIGGTSGPLYAIFLMAASGVVRRNNGSTSVGMLIAEAFEAGVDALSRLGGAKVGDRTMLDALIPAIGSLKEHSGDIRKAIETAAEASRRGADATADMMPKRGRSSYLGDRALGYKDPGAEAVAIWLSAISNAFSDNKKQGK